MSMRTMFPGWAARARRALVRVAPALLFLLAVLGWPAAASAHANLVRAEPAVGAAVPVAPTEVRLWFSEEAEARYSEIEVFDSERRRYDDGTVRTVPGDPLALATGVRDLPAGNYSVAWRATSAVDGHTTSGLIAFAVGNVPPPPPDPAIETTTFTPPTPAEVAVKWLTLLAAATVVGTAGLWLLVWLPVLRRARGDGEGEDDTLATPVARRLLLLASTGAIVLVVATFAGLLLSVAKATGSSVFGALRPGILGDALFTTRGGRIWLARLILALVAAVPCAFALRGMRRGAAASGEHRAGSYFGIAVGATYLLTISLTSHGAASALWRNASIALDVLHLLGTSFWVGGVGGFALTVPLLRGRAGSVRALLLGLIARFSNIALASIGVLTVTGLYSAWLHVGSLDALLPTTYGRVLVIKLVLVAGMVALGAFYLLWVRPRLEPAAAGGAAKPDETARARTYFGRAIRLEAALGVGVLLAVALLTGLVPAREAIVQARAPQRSQTASDGDMRVTLTLATLQPGNNAFDILIKDKSGRPVTNAEKVALRIEMLDMTMEETELVAAPRGEGHYAASGSLLSMRGNWQLRVIARRPGAPDVVTSYHYVIGAAAASSATAPGPTAPAVSASLAIRAIALAILLAAAALLGAAALSPRRRPRLLMLLTTAVVLVALGGGMFWYDFQRPATSRAAADAPPVDAATAGLALNWSAAPAPASGRQVTVRYRLADMRTNQPVLDLPISHDRPMHLIVVSSDLTQFQHIHPQLGADGTYTVEMELPTDGTYLLYDEFLYGEYTVLDRREYVAGGARTGAATLSVDGAPKTIDGVSVAMAAPGPVQAGKEVQFTFTLTRDGQPVTDLTQYLAADAHVAIVSADGTRFAHTHGEATGHTHSHTSDPAATPAPLTFGPDIRFTYTFPQPGMYKIWGQFNRGGTIITAPFVVEVR